MTPCISSKNFGERNAGVSSHMHPACHHAVTIPTCSAHMPLARANMCKADACVPPAADHDPQVSFGNGSHQCFSPASHPEAGTATCICWLRGWGSKQTEGRRAATAGRDLPPPWSAPASPAKVAAAELSSARRTTHLTFQDMCKSRTPRLKHACFSQWPLVLKT